MGINLHDENLFTTKKNVVRRTSVNQELHMVTFTKGKTKI
jgi:hypothetical protein